MSHELLLASGIVLLLTLLLPMLFLLSKKLGPHESSHKTKNSQGYKAINIKLTEELQMLINELSQTKKPVEIHGLPPWQIRHPGATLQPDQRSNRLALILFATCLFLPLSRPDCCRRGALNVYPLRGGRFMSTAHQEDLSSYVLRRMIKKAAEAGYVMNVGPEVEYFYFKNSKTPEPIDYAGR